MTTKADDKPTKEPGMMTAAELEAHIKENDEQHRKRQKYLRALLRIRQTDEF